MAFMYAVPTDVKRMPAGKRPLANGRTQPSTTTATQANLASGESNKFASQIR
jgi:hypothetical protein